MNFGNVRTLVLSKKIFLLVSILNLSLFCMHIRGNYASFLFLDRVVRDIPLPWVPFQVTMVLFAKPFDCSIPMVDLGQLHNKMHSED